MSFYFMCSALMLSYSQDLPDMESLMAVSGAESPEEMDAGEVERLLHYVERPLRVNDASVEQLVSSGLMSMYQAVSLVDYRERHGAPATLTELSAVDGFTHEHVRRISYFITLETGRHPGTGPYARYDMAIRTGCSNTGDRNAFSYGVKAKVEVGDRISVSASASSSAVPSVTFLDKYSGSISYEFASIPLRLLAGDFKARFGQGLALWNGMSMSGIPSPSACMRTPYGLSDVYSFTGGTSLTGIAADLGLNRFKLTAFLASPGIKYGYSSMMPAVNLAWRSRNVQIGVTHYCETRYSSKRNSFMVDEMKTSADMVACVRGTDVFMEIAYDWKNVAVACIAGTSFKVGEGIRLASMLRYYPALFDSRWSGAIRSGTKCSNEYAAAVSCSMNRGGWVKIAGAEGFGTNIRRHSASFSADAAYYPVAKSASVLGKSIQVKVLADWSVMLSESLRLKLRFSERFRTWGHPFRTDARADLSWLSSRFTFNSRLNVLCCEKTGIAAYVEGGYKVKDISVFLRHGYFKIDDWDDRIYVYERDAPGSFNVPALYGRGIWVSLYAMCKTCRKGRLYVRCSYTGYPFMQKKKPGRAELKLQYVMSF